jgi:hypothetical protein
MRPCGWPVSGRAAQWGEMGLLEKQPRSAEVVADEDVEAYLLT